MNNSCAIEFGSSISGDLDDGPLLSPRKVVAKPIPRKKTELKVQLGFEQHKIATVELSHAVDRKSFAQHRDTARLYFNRRVIASAREVIGALPEFEFEPSNTAIRAYRRAYASKFDGLIHRLVFSSNLINSRKKATESLLAAVFCGADFYIAHHHQSDRQDVPLGDIEVYKLINCVANYLGDLEGRSRQDVATHLIVELSEQLRGKKISLLNGQIAGIQGGLFVSSKVMGVASFVAEDDSYPMAA